jgi:signal transduction histidine kinase
MNIRTRLAVQFLLLASLILGVAFVIVHGRASEFREDEFRVRLHARALTAAKMLAQTDVVDDQLVMRLKQDNPMRLPEEVITIFDMHDSVLFHMGAEHRASPLTALLLDSVRTLDNVKLTFGDREFMGFIHPNGEQPFTVLVSGLDIYGRSKLSNQGRVMVITFLLGLVLIFLVGRFFAQRALSPLQRLVDELHRIGASDLSRRIRLGNETDELAQLATSFNDLLSRLQASFLGQKNFIANASHEMRTPLTAIAGQIDVLLLRDRTTADYTSALRSVQEDLRSVNRLSNRLLLMAQAETDASNMTFAPVRMDELLWAARSEVLRASAENKVQVIIDGLEDEKDLLVQGNEVLLRSMLVNLIENACKYSGDHQATVSLVVGGPKVLVTVADEGPGIALDEHERIFQHFYRTGNTSGVEGHGIGLSLVKRIVELHGGHLSLRSAIGQGTTFTVELLKAV